VVAKPFSGTCAADYQKRYGRSWRADNAHYSFSVWALGEETDTLKLSFDTFAPKDFAVRLYGAEWLENWDYVRGGAHCRAFPDGSVLRRGDVRGSPNRIRLTARPMQRGDLSFRDIVLVAQGPGLYAPPPDDPSDLSTPERYGSVVCVFRIWSVPNVEDFANHLQSRLERATSEAAIIPALEGHPELQLETPEDASVTVDIPMRSRGASDADPGAASADRDQEMQRLREQIADLKEENNLLTQQDEALRQKIGELEQNNDELRKENDALQQLNAKTVKECDERLQQTEEAFSKQINELKDTIRGFEERTEELQQQAADRYAAMLIANEQMDTLLRGIEATEESLPGGQVSPQVLAQLKQIVKDTWMQCQAAITELKWLQKTSSRKEELNRRLYAELHATNAEYGTLWELHKRLKLRYAAFVEEARKLLGSPANDEAQEAFSRWEARDESAVQMEGLLATHCTVRSQIVRGYTEVTIQLNRFLAELGSRHVLEKIMASLERVECSLQSSSARPEEMTQAVAEIKASVGDLVARWRTVAEQNDVTLQGLTEVNQQLTEQIAASENLSAEKAALETELQAKETELQAKEKRIAALTKISGEGSDRNAAVIQILRDELQKADTLIAQLTEDIAEFRKPLMEMVQQMTEWFGNDSGDDSTSPGMSRMEQMLAYMKAMGLELTQLQLRVGTFFRDREDLKEAFNAIEVPELEEVGEMHGSPPAGQRGDG